MSEYTSIMNKNDIVKFLPSIHNMDTKEPKKRGLIGYSKYQILKICNEDINKGNYKKVNECIDMGFLKKVNDDPPEFIPDKNKIWKFWKNTPSGQESKKMIGQHLAVFE